MAELIHEVTENELLICKRVISLVKSGKHYKQKESSFDDFEGIIEEMLKTVTEKKTVACFDDSFDSSDLTLPSFSQDSEDLLTENLPESPIKENIFENSSLQYFFITSFY